MFKKTLPGSASSFVQLMSGVSVRDRALAILRSTRNPNIDFIALALHGKKIGFEKVISMIDEMVDVLGKEQKDDDSKKEYCAAEFDATDDKKKALERSISDSGAAIADAEESLTTLAGEIKALGESIAALDKSVAEA